MATIMYILKRSYSYNLHSNGKLGNYEYSMCHTFKLKYIFLMNLQKKKNREKIEVVLYNLLSAVMLKNVVDEKISADTVLLLI